MGITVFVPRSEVTIHDTWDTTGLRGTASNDFSIERAFVAATRAFRVLVDPPQRQGALSRPAAGVHEPRHTRPRCRAGGAGRCARPIPRKAWGGTAMWEQPQVQAALAEATASVEAARSYLYGTAEQLWTAAQLGEHTARLRLATSHVEPAGDRSAAPNASDQHDSGRCSARTAVLRHPHRCRPRNGRPAHLRGGRSRRPREGGSISVLLGHLQHTGTRTTSERSVR